MARTKSAETPDTKKEQRIKTLWRNKKITKSFKQFYDWYLSQEKKQKGQCCYCGITEQEIARLYEITKLTTGSPLTKSKKGKHLEIERKSPNKGYDDFSNLALACHWCNNAKTDTFTAKEFKKIGDVFKQIWKDRLKDGK